MADRATAYLLKTPIFDEVIRNLDQQIGVINHQNGHKIHAAEDEPFVLIGEDLF